MRNNKINFSSQKRRRRRFDFKKIALVVIAAILVIVVVFKGVSVTVSFVQEKKQSSFVLQVTDTEF
jgi:hypothetical protein